MKAMPLTSETTVIKPIVPKAKSQISFFNCLSSLKPPVTKIQTDTSVRKFPYNYRQYAHYVDSLNLDGGNLPMNTVIQLRPSKSEKSTIRGGRAKNADYRQSE
jgi:hypothetical protein